MIHHISLFVREPERVAGVLAELLGGYAGPFVGGIPGGWIVYSDDEFGTGIEIYPEQTTLVPGQGEAAATVVQREPPPSVGFHAFVSVKVDRTAIERIGAREGWRTRHFWRGPSGVRLFELYEFWVENRILLELATEDRLASYLTIANGAANGRLLDARKARGPA
jgi:hypothetical protein